MESSCNPHEKRHNSNDPSDPFKSLPQKSCTAVGRYWLRNLAAITHYYRYVKDRSK